VQGVESYSVRLSGLTSIGDRSTEGRVGAAVERWVPDQIDESGLATFEVGTSKP
jgi:hypothetical protein